MARIKKEKTPKKISMRPRNKKPLAKVPQNSYTFHRDDKKVVITAISRKEAITKFNN